MSTVSSSTNHPKEKDKKKKTAGNEQKVAKNSHRHAAKPHHHIDWRAFLANPAHFLLRAEDFPGNYTPRTLTLAERGQAIQDVGRAGVDVTNFPGVCAHAGGRIGQPDDTLAMQMAARGNDSLTLVVIKNDDPRAAVEEWSSLNDNCPAFLSTENGVTSKVSITKIDAPVVDGKTVSAYHITTTTANLRGSTTQEQVLYAVPLDGVVLEVMGMSFNGEVNTDETQQVLVAAVEQGNTLEQQTFPEGYEPIEN